MSLEKKLFNKVGTSAVLGAALLGSTLAYSGDGNKENLSRTQIERDVVSIYTHIVNSNPDLRRTREGAYGVLSEVIDAYREVLSEEGLDEKKKYLDAIQARPLANWLQRADDEDIIFRDAFAGMNPEGYSLVGVPSSLEGVIGEGESSGSVDIPGDCIDALGNSVGVSPSTYEFSGPPGLDNIIAYCSANPFVRQNISVTYDCSSGTEWDGEVCSFPSGEPTYTLVGVGDQVAVLDPFSLPLSNNTINLEGKCEDNLGNQFPIIPREYSIEGPPGTDEVLVSCSQDPEVNKIIQVSYDCPEWSVWSPFLQRCN